MRRLFAFVIAVVITTGGLSETANAQGWVSALKVLPITEITGQIGTAAAYLIDLIKDHKKQIRADSVGSLVIDLANLAGLESALADRIDALAHNPADAHNYPGSGGSTVMDSLNDQLTTVREAFTRVNMDLSYLDPQWAQANASIQINVGSFTHDGALFYCIKDCGTNFYTGQPAVRLTDPQETSQLTAVLRADVVKIRQIAQAIQTAETQPQATR
jgi:hypothetical protein